MYKEAADANGLRELSLKKTVRVFKHSMTCGSSLYAKEAVDAYMEESGLDVYLVVVQSSRALSDDIAETFGIRHESPQYLVVMSGKARAVSHFGITREAMARLEQVE